MLPASDVALAAINSPSPLIHCGVDVLDPVTLKPTGEDLPVDADAGGQITWSYRPSDPTAGATEAVQVRRGATLTTADVSDELLLGRAFRLWKEMTAPDRTVVRFDRGTFWSTLPGKVVDANGRVTRPLTLLPREHRWATRSLDDYMTVRAADPVLDLIRADMATIFGITKTAFPAPDGATTLGSDRVFPAGTTYYAKWAAMLAGIAYDQPTTTVLGVPTAQPLATIAGRGPEIRYAPLAPGEVGPARRGRLIVPASVDPTDPALPNVIRFAARGPSLGPIEGNGLYTVRNEATGPGSITARGGAPQGEVFLEVAVEAVGQAELVAAGEALKQRYFAGGGTRLQIKVGLNPLHDDRDVVEVVHPLLDLSGVWLVTDLTEPHSRMLSPDAALTDLTCELRVTEEAA